MQGLLFLPAAQHELSEIIQKFFFADDTNESVRIRVIHGEKKFIKIHVQFKIIHVKTFFACGTQRGKFHTKCQLIMIFR